MQGPGSKAGSNKIPTTENDMSSNQGLHRKIVVVVGGSSGIGFAVAKAALNDGAQVIIASSDEAKVSAAADRLGGGARGHALDVTNEAAVAAFFERLQQFDHLVFTAGDTGTMPGGPVTELALDSLRSVFAVRFWGALAVVKHAARWIAPDGSITLTDGMLAHRPFRNAAVTSAMLGGIEHLTRALAGDLAPLRVNAVCPGVILTDRTAMLPEEMLRHFTSTLPLPRVGDPAEAAEAYLYLMRGSYTTGQVLKVDGGASVI